MNRLYLAYGSNINQKQMAVRCPDAQVVGTGIINDYELIFKGDENGYYATIQPHQGKNVPVRIWQITAEDEQALDGYEDWPTMYRKEDLTVSIGAETMKGMVYVMNDHYEQGLPSEKYYQIILDGYHQAGFDEEFLKDAYSLST